MSAISEAAVEGISGAVGSVLALLATYPLKTIYTLQALSTSNDSNGAAAVVSTMDIIRKYKLSGLYIGVEPNIIESAASSGVYFYLYSKLRDFAVRSKQAGKGAQAASGSTKNVDIGVLSSLLVAAVAGAGNQLITLPASVLATRMQAQAKARMDSGNDRVPTDALSVLSMIYKESGIMGFWKGLLPSLILVINPAVQYMLYEQLLRLLRQWKQKKAEKEEGAEAKPVKLSPGEIFLTSALAKIGATIVTYPLLVVKSRLQAAGKNTDIVYNGTLDCIFTILKGEGIGGFFKGLRAKILQTALNAALMLMLKEQCYTATRALLAGGPKATNLVK